jgi:hypothetical protein
MTVFPAGKVGSIAPVDTNGYLNETLTIQAQLSGMDPDSPRPHCPFAAATCNSRNRL